MNARFLLVILLIMVIDSHGQSVTATVQEEGQKQEHVAKKRGKPPVCYIGTSTGMNNPTGVLGLDFNIRLADKVTLDAGAGVSTWGNKLFVGSKYYLKPFQRGFAFGGGLTFNSGQDNRTARLETVNGRQRVTLMLKPQANIYVAAYRYWNLGRRYNRFFVDLGWSVPLLTHRYEELHGSPPLTAKGRQREEMRAPGGLMFGAGFSFALHGK